MKAYSPGLKKQCKKQGDSVFFSKNSVKNRGILFFNPGGTFKNRPSFI
jgi:hypothetical protein